MKTLDFGNVFFGFDHENDLEIETECFVYGTTITRYLNKEEQLQLVKFILENSELKEKEK